MKDNGDKWRQVDSMNIKDPVQVLNKPEVVNVPEQRDNIFFLLRKFKQPIIKFE